MTSNPLSARRRTVDSVAPQIERTSRSFKQDLVDHMNRTMNETAKDRGLAWMIAGNGEVYIDTTFAATRKNIERDHARQEAERTDWKRQMGYR